MLDILFTLLIAASFGGFWLLARACDKA